MASQQSSQSIKPQRPDMSSLRPPKSAVVRFFWRWKMWIDGTFVSSMLEPWEIFVLWSFFFLFISLLVGGIYRYLPSQATLLVRRAHYYLVGADSNAATTETLLPVKEL
ncbi:hypothetical protein K439DRAFT_1353910 [Ramaria rubella]|nr:hypothetical protein K439DRAFT_1353910 [Ramaria rubella]